MSSVSDNGNSDYGDSTDWSRDPRENVPIVKVQPSYQESSGGRRRSSPRVSLLKEEEDEDCCCCPVDPVLCWFRFFHTISGLIGFATMTANIFVLATVDRKSLNYKDIIMRSYAVIFCIIIVFTG
jgi:hypothetical protein